MTHSTEIELEISLGKDDSDSVVVDIEYKVTSAGSPAHMGSLNYPGHPAEPIEIELERIYWPYARKIKEGERAFKPSEVPMGWTIDHIDLPVSAIPSGIYEAIINHIVENYEPDLEPDYD